jgi:hypothetical protein
LIAGAAPEGERQEGATVRPSPSASGAPNRPAVPVALPYAPPPAAPAAPAKPSRRGLKILGVVGLAVACLLIGGFVLPGGSPPSVPSPDNAAPAASVTADSGEAPAAASPKADKSEEPRPPARPFDAAPEIILPAGKAYDLTRTINREIDKGLLAAAVPPSPLAADAEFLRRAYLDIAGHIPPYEKTVAFLVNPDPLKRSKLIDELLASPEYGRHFAHLWTDLLVKRDPDTNKNLKSEPFAAWLAEQFNQNRHWDTIVTELVTASGQEEQAPATFFVLANQDNNQASPSKLVDATGNLFLGIQVQCCQCHTHPFKGNWETKDFWGLAAFFGHTRIEREGAGKGGKGGVATVAEEARAPRAAGPKKGKKNDNKPLPAGATIAIPDPTDPNKTIKTVQAKFFEGDYPVLGQPPYRQALAAWLVSEKNHYFARAAVNRVWHHFFGRGLVNPIEDMKDENEPSHPALLQALADDFTRSGYDLKHLIRAVCNSKAYQRTSRPLPDNGGDEKWCSKMAVKVIGARELLASLAVATGHQAAEAPAPTGKQAAKGFGQLTGLRFFDTREYGDDPTDYSYGVPQMLKMMNTALTNSSAEVAARLAKSAGGNPDKVLDDIFLTALARPPRPQERDRMKAFVVLKGDPVKGYAGVFWALLNSAEFVSNH